MLILARHGQSEANASGLLLGRTDSPLTALGYEQARALGRALGHELGGVAARMRPVKIVSSPLARALATSAEIATGLAAGGPAEIATGRFPGDRPGAGSSCAPMGITVDDRWIEVDYGDYEGEELTQVPAETWALWRKDPSFRPPGGESLSEVAERVGQACEELVDQACDADVVVVSHVSPIKAALAWALDSDVLLAWRLHLSVASMSRIAFDQGHRRPVLHSFNETWHLAGIG